MNDRKGYEMAIDIERRQLRHELTDSGYLVPRVLQSGSAKLNLRSGASVDRVTARQQLFFEYSRLLGPIGQFKGDNILTGPALNLDFDFKPHRHVGAAGG